MPQRYGRIRMSNTCAYLRDEPLSTRRLLSRTDPATGNVRGYSMLDDEKWRLVVCPVRRHRSRRVGTTSRDSRSIDSSAVSTGIPLQNGLKMK